MMSALLLAAAAALSTWRPPEGRIRPFATTGRPKAERSRTLSPLLASVLASVAILVSFPTLGGGAAALLTVSLLPRLLGRLEPSAQRRRRLALARQALPALDLLAACLSSGAEPSAALEAVARATPEPLAGRLASVGLAMRLGDDPASAWGRLLDVPGFDVPVRVLVRSSSTGVGAVEQLVAARRALTEQHHAQALAAARSAGVRTVLPLGLCFLPAFILVGVVPVVASVLPELFEGM